MKFVRSSIYKMKIKSQGGSLEKLKLIEDIQFFPPEKITEIQEEKLKKIILHSYYNVPYYRQLMDNKGIVENNKVNLKRFTDIPILEKSDLIERFEELKSNDLKNRKSFVNSSGGSTGEPVSFIQDKEYYDWMMAVKFLFNKWAGIDFGDSLIRLWGSERDLFVGKETLKTMVGRLIKSEKWLNAFRMNNEDMEKFLDEINNMKPNHILAYVESIYELARYIELNNKKVYSPESIMTSAGTLYPHMRDTIERVFDTEIFNRYGSREVGDIACECSNHNGLHISSLTHFIEVINPDGTPAKNGVEGELIVTPLTNFSMPLLRYRIGDTGTISREVCSCGRGFPLLEKVSGRITDRFIRPDGSIVIPIYLIHIVGVVLYDKWIRKFQIIQEDYNEVKVKIVLQSPNNDPHLVYKNQLNEITDKIKFVMGKECNISYEFVNNIPPTSSGKYRYIISKVEG
ncbi:phenylacetate-CoA ligase [Mesobacillus persicus]|uniref:Phenylacetate-CoA ligase n=1 Tax=Mesobacillus persicus TaxID=930146 RepID=A0A1H8A8A3_9BACI|nr:phenylacetate--CoA ligase family protein [Mesobacillus persicus]SEM66058.1 phenylacetate-CoA ligase [Mesobacillus persicus]